MLGASTRSYLADMSSKIYGGYELACQCTHPKGCMGSVRYIVIVQIYGGLVNLMLCIGVCKAGRCGKHHAYTRVHLLRGFTRCYLKPPSVLLHRFVTAHTDKRHSCCAPPNVGPCSAHLRMHVSHRMSAVISIT